MKTRDWQAIITPTTLLIGENSTLQWSDEVPNYPMFVDYYFNHAPYELGERSRYAEAKLLFETIALLSNGVCRPEQVYATLLSNEALLRPPKGKHTLIPELLGEDGVEHIKNILRKYPTIKYIFALGLQTNYYLQRFGLYSSGESSEMFLKGSEPRRVGLQSYDPFYQPVNAKPFREVCFRRFAATDFEGVEVIPMLAMKSYPLAGVEADNFGANFEELKASFKDQEA